MLVYISSGKCYTYIMCRVWLRVSVFLQACAVLWFLNILCVVCFGVLCICIDDYMHELYIQMHKTPKHTTHKMFKNYRTPHACRNTLTQSHTPHII